MYRKSGYNLNSKPYFDGNSFVFQKNVSSIQSSDQNDSKFCYESFLENYHSSATDNNNNHSNHFESNSYTCIPTSQKMNSVQNYVENMEDHYNFSMTNENQYNPQTFTPQACGACPPEPSCGGGCPPEPSCGGGCPPEPSCGGGCPQEPQFNTCDMPQSSPYSGFPPVGMPSAGGYQQPNVIEPTIEQYSANNDFAPADPQPNQDMTMQMNMGDGPGPGPNEDDDAKCDDVKKVGKFQFYKWRKQLYTCEITIEPVPCDNEKEEEE